jgi:ubiquinone biosynthesis protein
MNRPMVPRPGMALKRLRRFQHVINVLVKHGFGEMLARVRVWESGAIERRLLHRKTGMPAELTQPQRIRLALEELGPTFIKMGQILSTRPDLVSPEIITELKKLQYSVHFVSADIIRKIVETELGRPISEVFDSFDDEPLAAASLAQVHRAVLKGKHVVLKVQRPNILETAETDIEIMRSLAALAERYSPTLHLINPVGIVEEFAQQINKELDFLMEAHNALRFAQNFAQDKSIHVPKIYLDFCSKRLVTMEFLDGINIAETRRLVDEKYDLRRISSRGATVGFKAIFQYGFFHADPHPGNVLVLPGDVIGLVDFGMMATMSMRDRERLAKLVYFISMRDDKQVARALNELMESEDVIPAEELEPAMSAIIREYGDLPTRELRLANMLFAMIRAIIAHGGTLRPQLLWITKSIAVQEEIARSLNADFSLMEVGRPYAQKVLDQKLNPLHHPKDLYYWLIDAIDLVKDLPYDAGIIMREIRKGRIKIEFEHVGLEPIQRSMDRMSNRGSLTNIIVALLISSSLIVLAKIPPFIGNIALLGFIGYVFASILGLVLIASVLLRGRR